MNVLFVTPAVPKPIGGGGMRMFYEIKYLIKEGINVSLLSYSYRESVDLDLGLREVYLFEVEYGFRQRLKNFVYGKTYPFYKDFKHILDKIYWKFDIIHVHKFQMAEYLLDVRKPIVVDLWATGLKGPIYDFLYERNPFEKIVKLMRIPRFFLADRFLYPKFKFFFVPTLEAKDFILKRYPDKKVYVVPNGITDIHYDNGERERNTMVFVGDMSFPQNVDSVLWFCSKILPYIKEEIPDVKFYVVGPNPSFRIGEIKDKSVFIVGFVEDLGEYLKKCEVFVAPIRSGRGIRQKILTALSYGISVVSTPYALEGIPAEDGKEVLIARSEKDFAEKVIYLLKNPHIRKEIGDRGREFVKRFLWERIVKDMIRYYEELL